LSAAVFPGKEKGKGKKEKIPSLTNRTRVLKKRKRRERKKRSHGLEPQPYAALSFVEGEKGERKGGGERTHSAPVYLYQKGGKGERSARSYAFVSLLRGGGGKGEEMAGPLKPYHFLFYRFQGRKGGKKRKGGGGEFLGLG